MDTAHQNAPCELMPNSESDHALLSVRPMIRRQRCGTAPPIVGTGPLPSGCHGAVMTTGSDTETVNLSGRRPE